jgi:hypothetical protein
MKWFIIIMFVFMAAVAMSGENQMAPSIQDVKKQHETRLLKLQGVVSVGIGLDEKGRRAIVIGLDGANPDIAARLPETLDGYPVTIKIVGPIKAQ